MGELPLPPYIKRQTDSSFQKVAADNLRKIDNTRYQTTYARQDKAGSVAAPTAGLHFTPELRTALEDSGRQWAEVTLYVGYGTFSPVRSQDIRQHRMHAEYAELPPATAQAITQAKADNRKIIAVGTTSARVIEGAWRNQHANPNATCPAQTEAPFHLDAMNGWVNLFLYPGQRFHVIDGLITNFHLPQSSLLMLAAAFAGRKKILAAYEQAIHHRFHFFSYGDAMLLL